jgi:D-alanyl-D-alanine carboxypeptidase
MIGKCCLAALLIVGAAGATAPAADTSSPHSIPHRAPAVPADSIDAHIHTLMAERQIPGLSLVVVKDGSIIKEGHYGLANVELNVPVNENTSFMIASMSKAFTAAGLLLLVEDGKVALDDPAAKYLDGLPATWSDVTLRRLLNHTAGLRDDWRTWDAARPGGNEFFLTRTTNEEFLRELIEEPLLFTPGERVSYGCGPFVVGMIIEKVAGMPYAEFMRTRIFEPLGMTYTMIYDALAVVPHRASGYRLVDGALQQGFRISPAAEARGDVGVLTTALDMAKWDAAMRDTRLLSRSSLEAMFAPAVLNDGSTSASGLGWFAWPVRGYRSVAHSGGFRTGFSSTIERYLHHDLTIIVLTNLWESFDGGAIGSVVASFYEDDYRRISSMATRTDPDAERSRMLRSVLEVIGSGTIDRERMTAGFPIDAFNAERWRERHDALGSFAYVDCQDRPTGADASAGDAVHEVCFYRFSETRGSGYLVYVLTQDGKVADLYTEEFVPHPHGALGDAAAAPATHQRGAQAAEHVAAAVDHRAIATSMARNADIREGELVWIYGGAQDVEFMEKLAVAVAALGGQPLVSLFSDVTMRDWYRDVPERFDTMRDDWRWQIHQNADVVFLLSRVDPATYAGIAPERLGGYRTGNPGLWDVVQERGVRIVNIGNRVHPSEWSARMFGIEQSELESIYWKGMATDAARLTSTGERFREILRGASTVRIQHPNGTDITVGVTGQRIVVTDGSFSPTRTEPDPSTGFYETWLPGGEVTLGVDPESAEGRLVLERFFLDGQDMGPTTLTFSGGRLVALESGSTLSRLREHTQSALPMSDRLTGLKFGVNPEITDARILPWMGAGMVSPTLGNNLVLGGDLDLPYGPVFLTLAGSTIHVDDQIVVEDGVLKL